MYPHREPKIIVRENQKDFIELDVHKSVSSDVEEMLSETPRKILSRMAYLDRQRGYFGKWSKVGLTDLVLTHIRFDFFPRSRRGSEWSLVRLVLDIDPLKRALKRLDGLEYEDSYTDQFTGREQFYDATLDTSRYVRQLEGHVEGCVKECFDHIKKDLNVKVANGGGHYDIGTDFSQGYRLASGHFQDQVDAEILSDIERRLSRLERQLSYLPSHLWLG